jgi:serine/threonine protein kinase
LFACIYTLSHAFVYAADADSVKKLLDSCRAQFSEREEWNEMHAAVSAGNTAPVAAADIDAGVVEKPTAAAVTRCEGVEEGDTVSFKIVVPKPMPVAPIPVVVAPAPAPVVPVIAAAPAPVVVAPVAAPAPAAAPTAESIRKSLTRKFGTAMRVTEPTVVEPVPAAIDTSITSDAGVNTSLSSAPVPEVRSTSKPRSIMNPKPMASGGENARPLPPSIIRKEPSAVVTPGAGHDAPGLDTSAMSDKANLSAVAKRRRTTMLRPFISNLSPVVEKEDKTPAGRTDTDAASSGASSTSEEKSAARGPLGGKTRGSDDTAAIMATIPTPHDFTTQHQGGLNTSSTMHSTAAALSFSHYTMQQHDTHLNTSVVEPTARITATQAAVAPKPKAAPASKVAFEVPDYIKNFNIRQAPLQRTKSEPTPTPSNGVSAVSTSTRRSVDAASVSSDENTSKPSSPLSDDATVKMPLSAAGTSAPVTPQHVSAGDDMDEDEDALISPVILMRTGSGKPAPLLPPPIIAPTAKPVPTVASPPSEPTIVFQQQPQKGKAPLPEPTQEVSERGEEGGEEDGMDFDATLAMAPQLNGGLGMGMGGSAAPVIDADSSFDDTDDDVISFHPPPRASAAAPSKVVPSPPMQSSAAVTSVPSGPGLVRRPSDLTAPLAPLLSSTHLPTPSAASGDGPNAVQAFLQTDAREIVSVGGHKYLKLDCIGKGGSSRVYRVLGEDMQTYAMKRVRLNRMDASSISSYSNEIALLKKLSGHRHIIRLVAAEVSYESKCIHMVMEYGQCDLNKMLSDEREKGGGAIDPNVLRLVWQQMLVAVQTIHEARIVHGDLKPANFVFVEGVLKLIDFGIAKAISNDTTNIVRDGQVGTVNYMSPEAIQDGSGGYGNKGAPVLKLGRASDIWSLGCILYQMAYGKTPFADLSLIHKLQAICDSRYSIAYPPMPIDDPELLDVLHACLNREPSKRLPIGGAAGLLSHPFLKPQLRHCRSVTPSDAISLEDVGALLRTFYAAVVPADARVPAALESLVTALPAAFKRSGEEEAADVSARLVERFAALLAASAPVVAAAPCFPIAAASKVAAAAKMSIHDAIRGRAPRAGAPSPAREGRPVALPSPRVVRSASVQPQRSVSGPQLQQEILQRRAALKPVSLTAEDKENALPSKKHGKSDGVGLEAVLRRGLSQRFGQVPAAHLEHSVGNNGSIDLDSSWMPM